MLFKIYQIGHPLAGDPLGDIHTPVFQQQGLPISFEPCEVPPVNFHRVISGILRDNSCLGVKMLAPYKQTALAYCQEVSNTAQGIGAVNTLVRRPSGLIFGHNTDVAAFIRCLQDQKVKRVRTALILGAGGAARVALAGLRELACARYMIGYRQPRRPAELSSQFKGIRRQMNFFPLEEMIDFFTWAEEAEILGDRTNQLESMLSSEDDERDEQKESASDGPQRWSLLVNATPIGYGAHEKQQLLTSTAFLRCVDRVADMVPALEETRLIKLAREAQLPYIQGRDLFLKQAEYSRELWLKEYSRHTGQLEQAKAERGVVKVQMGQRRRRS